MEKFLKGFLTLVASIFIFSSADAGPRLLAPLHLSIKPERRPTQPPPTPILFRQADLGRMGAMVMNL